MPKTAAPSVSDYENFFARYVDEGKTVIHFNISSKASGSNGFAQAAQKKFGDKVYVVDSQALSMLIVEKRRDIATLRALGADTPLLRRIFRTEGLLICGLGAVIGLLLGVTLSLVQQYFGVIEIPAETFLTKSYPVELRLSDLFAVAVTFSLVSLLLADVTVRSMIKNTTRS